MADDRSPTKSLMPTSTATESSYCEQVKLTVAKIDWALQTQKQEGFLEAATFVSQYSAGIIALKRVRPA